MVCIEAQNGVNTIPTATYLASAVSKAARILVVYLSEYGVILIWKNGLS